MNRVVNEDLSCYPLCWNCVGLLSFFGVDGACIGMGAFIINGLVLGLNC